MRKPRRIPGTNIGMPAELLPNQPPIADVGELETVTDWKREVANLYRAMRRKQIDVRDGTAMAYVATVGANLAKIEEEIRDRDRIEAALLANAARIRTSGGDEVDYLPADQDAGSLEVLP